MAILRPDTSTTLNGVKINSIYSQNIIPTESICPLFQWKAKLSV